MNICKIFENTIESQKLFDDAFSTWLNAQSVFYEWLIKNEDKLSEDKSIALEYEKQKKKLNNIEEECFDQMSNAAAFGAHHNKSDKNIKSLSELLNVYTDGKSKRCNSCGFVQDIDHKYCEKCGREFEKVEKSISKKDQLINFGYCEECGEPITDPIADYCENCGKEIDKGHISKPDQEKIKKRFNSIMKLYIEKYKL